MYHGLMTRTRIGRVCLGSIAVAFAALGAGPAGAGSPATHEAFVESTNAWHAERIRKLTEPDGWLSLVALEWLEPGRNRVGRAKDSEVRYAGFPADTIGVFVLDGERVRFEAAEGIEIEGVPASGWVRSDADGNPTVLSIGDIRFYVVIRGGRPVIRIKDAAAPTRANFKGIERYRIDESWRIEAEFVPASEGELIGLDTVIGVREEGETSGRAKFEVGGVRVDAVLLAAGDGGSLLRFGDTTNGGETYVVGRYLYVPPSTDGKTVVLDFNRAYNPPCAFTAYATCTIPPPSNDFSFPVTAGERWAGGE